jgi:hypothetical protein
MTMTTTNTTTTTTATKKGKTLKEYEEEIKRKDTKTRPTQHLCRSTADLLVDDDLLNLPYYDNSDCNDDDDDDDYDYYYDSTYYDSDDEAYDTDDVPALQAPNIAIDELTADGSPINTSHYYWYPEDDYSLPLADNALLLPEPTDYPPEAPQDLPAFAAYADRCLDACSTPELYSAMQYDLENMFECYMHGDLQGIDWDNAPQPQPDPVGDLTNTDSDQHSLPRGGDPSGALLPSHDNLSYTNTNPPFLPTPLLPSDPTDPPGTSFPAIWIYPAPLPPAPFDKLTNTPPPSTTLRLQTVNDIDSHTIDDTWTAKALAKVAHTLLWGSASPVGRWACVPPLKKLRSKKMMMDSHFVAPAFRHIRI